MPLTIETGSGVAGANSFATVAEARAFASARGLSLPAPDASVEAALVLACDKVETYRFKGSKVDPAQALQWPRADVYVEDGTEPLASNAIPAKIKSAQIQFAIESAAGTDLQPTGTGQEVVREKVDVIETEFAPRGSGSVTPQFQKAEAYLAPFLYAGGGLGLTTYRA